MIETFISVGIFAVVLLHIWFFILETFLWQKNFGMKLFKLDADFAKRSAPLAANQGLYNLFLAAGLVWSLAANPNQGLKLKIFFLSCVLLAGIYGGMTVSKRIFFIQGLPAGALLLLVFFK